MPIVQIGMMIHQRVQENKARKEIEKMEKDFMQKMFPQLQPNDIQSQNPAGSNIRS